MRSENKTICFDWVLINYGPNSSEFEFHPRLSTPSIGSCVSPLVVPKRISVTPVRHDSRVLMKILSPFQVAHINVLCSTFRTETQQKSENRLPLISNVNHLHRTRAVSTLSIIELMNRATKRN